MQHLFDIEIANQYGVNVAIFLNNMAFWIQKNMANDKHKHDDRYWTFNSVEAYTMLFPYWSYKQLRKIIGDCVNNALIIEGNHNKSPYDRTKWYALTDIGLKLFNLPICPAGQMKMSSGANETVLEGRPIPDINTDSKTQIKPPEFLSKDLWEKFKDHRKKIKKPMTDYAIVLFLNKLTKMHEKGLNVTELLEESIINGWPSVYEPRKSINQPNQIEVVRPKYKDYTQERLEREAHEKLQ